MDTRLELVVRKNKNANEWNKRIYEKVILLKIPCRLIVAIIEFLKEHMN